MTAPRSSCRISSSPQEHERPGKHPGRFVALLRESACMLTRWMITGLVVLSATVAGCSSPGIDDALKPFQGSWMLVSFDEKGKKLSDPELKKVQLVVENDKAQYKVEDRVEEMVI